MPATVVIVPAASTTQTGWARQSRIALSDAAAPEIAEPLYDYFVESSRKLLRRVETGSFRKMMLVELVNDGPVTILLDSRKTF